MANDDVNINRPPPSSVHGGTSVSDTPTPPPVKGPRVDAGDGYTGGNGQGTSGSGPVLNLPKMMPATALTMMLFSLEQKVSSERIKSAKSEVQTETQKSQDADKKRIDDIKKMMEAQRKAHHHSKLGKILGWVGVALTYVAAVVVTVASGGAAAAPVFAAAVLMTGLMIAQETGGMHKLAQGMGLNKKGEMGLMIGLTAAVLVVSLVPVVMTGGAAAVSLASSVMSMISEATATSAEVGAGAAELTAAGAEAGSAGAEISADTAETTAAASEMSSEAGEVTSSTVDTSSEMSDVGAETADSSSEVSESSEEASQSTSKASDASKDAAKGQDIVEKSASRTQKVAARVGNVVNLASAGTSVASGATGIQTAEEEHDASMAEADATDQQATLASIQALQAATLRKLRKILEEMQANTKTVFSIVSSSNKLTEEISKGSSA